MSTDGAPPVQRDPAAMNTMHGPEGMVVRSCLTGEHFTVVRHNSDGTATVAWHGDAGPKAPRSTRQIRSMVPGDRIVAPVSSVVLVVETTGRDVPGGTGQDCCYCCDHRHVARGCDIHNRHGLSPGSRFYTLPPARVAVA